MRGAKWLSSFFIALSLFQHLQCPISQRLQAYPQRHLQCRLTGRPLSSEPIAAPSTEPAAAPTAPPVTPPTVCPTAPSTSTLAVSAKVPVPSKQALILNTRIFFSFSPKWAATSRRCFLFRRFAGRSSYYIPPSRLRILPLPYRRQHQRRYPPVQS